MADAVVFPGGAFGPAAGMLMYATAVAERRGATVHRHSWSGRPQIAEDWVRAEVGPALDAVGGRPLVVGKSLGTGASTVVAERSLPAVWLTPLLTESWVVEALGRSGAPFLLVGGTADAWWDGVAARRVSAHVLEVEGAGHGMQVPGPVTASIAVLGRMVEAIDAFLGEIGWPG